jgi:hypothetical protein
MNTLITKLYNHLKLIHLEDAATVLCGLLTAGKIPATAFDPINDDHEVRLDKSYWKALTAEQSEQVFQDGSAAVKEVMHSGKEVNFRMHIFVPDWALDLLPVRRQNIWLRLGLRLGEFRPHHGVDIKRRSCGAASVDVG